MSIGPALRTLALTDSTISTAVGTRVYPVMLPPEADVPSIAYREISGIADPVSTATDGSGVVMTTRVQFDIWTTTYLSCKSLKDALVKLFNRYSGTVGGSVILDILPDLTFDTFDDDLKLYRQVVDFRVTHEGT